MFLIPTSMPPGFIGSPTVPRSLRERSCCYWLVPSLAGHVSPWGSVKLVYLVFGDDLPVAVEIGIIGNALEQDNGVPH
jgi:hypothetical protein